MTRGLAIPKCARGHSGLPTELVFTVLSKHFTCHQLSTNYSVLVLVTYSHGTSQSILIKTILQNGCGHYR